MTTWMPEVTFTSKCLCCVELCSEKKEQINNYVEMTNFKLDKRVSISSIIGVN